MTNVSVAERVARGRAARESVPRSSHADYRPAPKRKSPIDVLEAQARTRVPELVPIRYARMSSSPFAFFRGAAAIMANDLRGTPRSGITAQLCGDAHLTNFGVFAAPDRRLVFDLNDFDETLPGPWEWDLKRLAASFEVATRDRDFNRATRREIVLSAVEGYRLAMLEFAERRNLEVWYARLDADELLGQLSANTSSGTRERLSRALTRAGARTSMQALAKLTTKVKGELRFAHQPPLLVPLGELLRGRAFDRADALLRKVLQQYGRTLAEDRRHLLEQYRLVDFARKVVGVGSVGTRAFVALMLGRDDDDPLFLQFKEAERSVLEPVAGASEYSNHGQRVVEGQRLMQAASDILLGFCRVRGVDKRQHDYYVRQLWDGKGSADPATARASLFSPYARACGWALARAHARSGDRIAIAAYLGRRGSFDDAIAKFAAHYADLNERDFDEFKRALKRGRLAAEPSV